MEMPSPDPGGEEDLSFSGVVLMKGHPRHQVLHHHGLGTLSVTSKHVRMLSYGSDEVLAESPAEQTTLGTSRTLNEFGSMPFVDFGDDSLPLHATQWDVDFGLLNDVVRLLHPTAR
jgi:hypothetical protein